MINELIEYQKQYNATISIKFSKINGYDIFLYNPDITVNSASVIKIAIMVALLEKVKENSLKLDKLIDFNDHNLEDYEGVYSETDKKATILELITFMIINSDNMATNVLIDLFGFDYFNEYFNDNNILFNSYRYN